MVECKQWPLTTEIVDADTDSPSAERLTDAMEPHYFRFS